MSVLIADDDPEICNVIGLALKAASIAYKSAHSAKEALTLMSEGGISFVILDLDMPGSGESLLMEIRDKYGFGIPVFVFTGEQRINENALKT